MQLKQDTVYRPASTHLCITFAKGSLVEEASNLPPDEQGRPRYWLSDLTPEQKANDRIESYYRNYGFLFSADEVEPTLDK